MSCHRYVNACAIAMALAATLSIVPAHADKPSWAGGGNKQERKHDAQGRETDRGRANDARGGKRQFAERDVAIVRQYYDRQISRGRCPPGLAKKRNGCMPPGQAKKWAVGRPIPAGVIYHDLPPALVLQLGRPPAGYKYVRIAADILMIAVGTGMVVDAIEDLGRL